ncbi:hypothetical protein H0I23_07145 [Cellulophaga sp. HaHaR_3_176]|uniref:hypothetical protein n=1 Tax=Cellulophaga sp. HaHaR_3_176 TaxID=1942464 RepID=UPI001C1FDD4C|nr:hypothetical protein [Cellulophaga sp. HaHaR_3_176]QWX85409.1 hypothetical protein H0I23_07145 [Cellulophaga sp. HaHaR_3_176]
MKKSLFFLLSILLFACNQPSNKSTSDSTLKIIGEEPEKIESIDIKSLFSLSPLTIFDETTEGLSFSEKNDLIKNGESASWRIADENKTKLAIQGKQPLSEVTLRFFKSKDNSDGLLFAQITNEQHTNLLTWNYSSKDKNLQESDVLKKYSANDFLSKEDKLPESYQPKLHYGFINDETIEVLLNTWMEKEFENREIINKIFLKWNGEKFEEYIVKGNDIKLLVASEENEELEEEEIKFN